MLNFGLVFPTITPVNIHIEVKNILVVRLKLFKNLSFAVWL